MIPALRARNVASAVRIIPQRSSLVGNGHRCLSTAAWRLVASRPANDCVIHGHGRDTTVFGGLRSFHGSAWTPKDYPDHMLLPMPALSPTMEMGTISKWELKEGDSFGPGSVICSVETDKATMDFEAQDDGIIAKILKDGPDAVDIPIGAPIAVVVEEESDVAAFADFTITEEAPAPAAATEEAVPATPASTAPVQNREVADEYILLPSARFLAESK